MDRRAFLKTATTGMLSASWGTPLRALAGDTLEDLCIQGAQERSIRLTPAMRRRISDEVGEFRLANAEPGLTRIAAVVRALKRRGHLIAAGLGHTSSSFVAHLLGLSPDLNPLDYRITFDLVLPRKKGLEVMVGLALEARALEEFLKMLEPRQSQEYLVFGPRWVGTECFMSGVRLYLTPLPEAPEDYTGVTDEYCEGMLDCFFNQYLEHLSPQSVEETALALSLFRLGLIYPRVFEEVLFSSRFGPDRDPVAVYREDALRLLMNATEITRLDAARILMACQRTLGQGRDPEPVDAVLSNALVKTHRLPQKATAMNGALHLRSSDQRLRRMARLYYCSGTVSDFLRAHLMAGLVRVRPESRDVIARLACS